MKFLIITHVTHKLNGSTISAYAPYVREMNIWLKHVDEVILVAPQVNKSITAIDLSYEHDNLIFKPILSINFTSIKNAFFSIIKVPKIVFVMLEACRKADHIHLRCPGNIGLLGCLVQVFFPKKTKTAKYAGNWDPDAKQPLSYKFQKWLLSNTLLTKHMTVLVYGNWRNQTQNIKSFFTATFSDEEKEKPNVRKYTENLKFVFVGSLVKGKRPLLAIKIVEMLLKKGKKVQFDIYGEGDLKEELKTYIVKNNLKNEVKLIGNKDKHIVKEALKAAHFLLLPSQSEGWPKAVAEAMFFGTIPITTSISCIPLMLDNGKRGILIEPNIKEALNKILFYLRKEDELIEMSKLATSWSQNYTLNTFETEIVKLFKQ